MRRSSPLILLLLPAWLLAGCAHTGRAPIDDPGAGVVLSLEDLSCQSCGEAVARLLEHRRGVSSAHFDRDRVEVAVRYDPTKTSPERLLAEVIEAGYVATIGAGHGDYTREVTFPEGTDVEWISRAGEDVDVEAHRVAGKVTVVDFYATWCGPCRDVDHEMLDVLQRDPAVALRKVNVVSWETPVARHYLADVAGLPYLVVYGRSGARVKVISGLHLDELRRAIDSAKTR